MRIDNLSEDVEEFTGNVWKMESDDETVLIDAGTGDEVWQEIRELENVDKLVLTHTHPDHVDNLPRIDDMFEPEIYAYKPGNLPVEGREIGESIELCEEKFRVIHTPGHKDDSICLHSDSGILFTGDLIFEDGSFGRTDLAEGDRDTLIESIMKITELDVRNFFPGHGEAVDESAEDSIRRSLEEARKHETKYS